MNHSVEAVKNIFRNKDNKNISINVLAMLFIKGGAMLISVLIIPAYKRYFNNDIIYGTWITVSTVFNWFTMFDFGIGNGLRNHLTKSLAEKDNSASKKYVSSSYTSIGIITLVLSVIGILVINIIDWNSVLKVEKSLVSLSVLCSYISIVFFGVMIHFFLLLISSICYAIQKTFLPGLMSLMTQIALLVYLKLFTAISINDKIIGISWCYLLAYNLPLLIITFYFFAGKLKEIKPSIRFFDIGTTKQVLSLGGAFFFVQIAVIALSSSDSVYINGLYSPENVVEYNYYHKLFYVLTSLLSLVMQPLWSAVTKAVQEKKYNWVKNVWKLVCVLCALVMAFCALLGVIFQFVADIWLGSGTLIVEPLKILMFVLWGMEMSVMTASTCFANGFGRLKCQLIFTSIGAVLKFALCFALRGWIENWIVIMIAGNLAMLPLIIAQPLSVSRYISNLSKLENEKSETT